MWFMKFSHWIFLQMQVIWVFVYSIFMSSHILYQSCQEMCIHYSSWLMFLFIFLKIIFYQLNQKTCDFSSHYQHLRSTDAWTFFHWVLKNDLISEQVIFQFVEWQSSYSWLILWDCSADYWSSICLLVSDIWSIFFWVDWDC